ncbi:hypothetical protein XI06_07225 [Bradyrhizobium sp. CCBAU 11434]|nr:hypothetical protein [Bradyrhizobium sp. CCBAU 11434]
MTDNARQHVGQILGFDLKTAGPWLDCVEDRHSQKPTALFPIRAIPIIRRSAVHVLQDANEQQRMEDYAQLDVMQLYDVWRECRMPQYLSFCTIWLQPRMLR